MRKTSQLFLKINGKEYKIVTFSNKVTLYHLLIFLGYKLNLIAIEYNGKIIPIYKCEKTYLINKSTIEIVTIVGGG
jgi:thiamine biosynthesis protein ThiS